MFFLAKTLPQKSSFGSLRDSGKGLSDIGVVLGKTLISATAGLLLSLSAGAQPAISDGCFSSPTTNCIMEHAIAAAMSLKDGGVDQAEAYATLGYYIATRKISDEKEIVKKANVSYEHLMSSAPSPSTKWKLLNIREKLIRIDKALSRPNVKENELALVREFQTLKNSAELSDIISFCSGIFDESDKQTVEYLENAIKPDCRLATEKYMANDLQETRVGGVLEFALALSLAGSLGISDQSVLNDKSTRKINQILEEIKKSNPANSSDVLELIVGKTIILLFQSWFGASTKSYFLCDIEVRDAIHRFRTDLKKWGMNDDDMAGVLDHAVAMGYAILSDVAIVQNLQKEKEALVMSMGKSLKRQGSDSEARLLLYYNVLDLLK